MNRCRTLSVSTTMHGATRFRSCLVPFTLLVAVVVASRMHSEDRRSEDILWSVDWSPDGRLAAVGGHWTGLVDAQTWERRVIPGLVHPKAVGVRWHPSAPRLAVSGFAADTSAIYDLATAQKTTLPTAEGTRGIAWNSTGELLATAGNDGSVQVWNATGSLLRTMRRDKAKSLTGVTWHPTENWIIAIGEFITLYDEAGNMTHEIRHRPEGKGLLLLLCVEWHSSGTFFVVGDYGNHDTGEAPALQFRAANGELLRTIEIPGGAAIRNISWSPDGSRLASASDALRVWSEHGELLHVGASPDFLWGVRWNPAGDRVLTSSQEGRVTLWNGSAEVVRPIVE